MFPLTRILTAIPFLLGLLSVIAGFVSMLCMASAKPSLITTNPLSKSATVATMLGEDSQTDNGSRPVRHLELVAPDNNSTVQREIPAQFVANLSNPAEFH